jgi:hypothetical protein
VVGVEDLREEGPQGDSRAKEAVAEGVAQRCQDRFDAGGGKVIGEGESRVVVQLLAGVGDLAA